MKKLLIFLFISLSLSAQNKDPYKILDTVKENFNTIKDYEVDATITVDVNFLRVPESKAKIYFKQPDKLKLDSEGFALLPKEGINFSPNKLLSGDFSAIYIKADTLQKHKVDIVKVIPTNDSAGVILTTLWIDSNLSVVRKMETTTKKNGTFEIKLNYDNSGNKFLPSIVMLMFNVNDIQIPKAISGEINNDGSSDNKKKKDEPMIGTVTIKYSNYKINKGIKDSFFEKEKR